MRSETDTELIAHLIADVRRQQWMPLEEAVRQALTQVCELRQSCRRARPGAPALYRRTPPHPLNHQGRWSGIVVTA
jgi:hypothetical protein